MLMKKPHLFGVLQVPPSLSTAGYATATTAELFLSNPMGVEPRSKKAHPWSFLWVSSWYVWNCALFMWLPLLLFLSLNSKGGHWVAGVVPRQRRSSVGPLHAQ
jgi:hypothetical protein